MTHSPWPYLVTPFFTWAVTGCLKFVINSIRFRSLALSLIGYGGLPSNHSAIVASMTTLIALREGLSHPAFGVALTFAFITVLDAKSLRGQMTKHAKVLNHLQSGLPNAPVLRERIGHSVFEILVGLLVGALCAYLINRCFV